MATSEDLETSSDYVKDEDDLVECDSDDEETKELKRHLKKLNVQMRKAKQKEKLRKEIKERESALKDYKTLTDCVMNMIDFAESGSDDDETRELKIKFNDLNKKIRKAKQKEKLRKEIQNREAALKECKGTNQDAKDLQSVDFVGKNPEQNVGDKVYLLEHMAAECKETSLNTTDILTVTSDGIREEQHLTDTECKGTNQDAKDQQIVDSVGEIQEQNVGSEDHMAAECNETSLNTTDILTVTSDGVREEQHLTDTECKGTNQDAKDQQIVDSVGEIPEQNVGSEDHMAAECNETSLNTTDILTVTSDGIREEQHLTNTECKGTNQDAKDPQIVVSVGEIPERNVEGEDMAAKCNETLLDTKDILTVTSDEVRREQNSTDTECKGTNQDAKDPQMVDSVGEIPEQNVGSEDMAAKCNETLLDTKDILTVTSDEVRREQNSTDTECKGSHKNADDLQTVDSVGEIPEQNVVVEDDMTAECNETSLDTIDILTMTSDVVRGEQNLTDAECKGTNQDPKDLETVDSVDTNPKQNVRDKGTNQDAKDLQTVDSVGKIPEHNVGGEEGMTVECKETSLDTKDILTVTSERVRGELNLTDTECKGTIQEAKDLQTVDSVGTNPKQNVRDEECKGVKQDAKDLQTVNSFDKNPEQYAADEECNETFYDAQADLTADTCCDYKQNVVNTGTNNDSGSISEQKGKSKEMNTTDKGSSQVGGKNTERKWTFVGNQKEKIDETSKRYAQKGSNSVHENENQIMTFCKQIGLDSFYPEKLQLSDVMKVVSKSEHFHLKQLGVLFLTNLIMFNFHSRDKMIQDFLRQISNQPNKAKKKVDNILDDLLGNDIGDISVSPLDLIISAFKCSSPMLQQVITSKLFMCKLAVPLILPTFEGGQCEIRLWPLRSIIFESRTNDSITQNNAVTCPCHVVSFVRMGRPAFSKSKLMNNIITDQYHNTFFNKDCPLGTAKRVIGDGLVETSWYLPSSKTSSILAHVTMFLNLRGNGTNLKDQMNLILQTSDVLVIVLDVERLTDDMTVKELIAMQKLKLKVLLLFDTKRHSTNFIKEHLSRFIETSSKSKNSPDLYILSNDSEDKSTATITEELRTRIHDLLKTKPIEQLIKRLHQVKTDEDKTVFRRTRKNAEELMKQIQSKDYIKKDEIVPLQGKLWHEWSKKEKEVNKSSQYLSLPGQGEIRKEMNKCRKKQATMCKKLGKFMTTLLSILNSSQVDVPLFITWLKLFLDDQSRKSIPAFLMEYQRNWQKLMKIKDQENVEERTKQSIQRALNDSEIKLAEASFGFEHLFREMGQIFEALEKLEKGRADLIALRDALPTIAANLIFLGQPFEIMDGDTGNVPITWVKAVFQCLKNRLGDKKLLALSVLGIQSSGKSTLLNAMFGLQFAVSAGRCTKGVFVQMVEVTKGQFPFDFILVIDTEGLRAPELAHQEYTHDNELATFVIGLGDITIVNIKGENTAEIKDVLQIAVHAFLRLRLANKEGLKTGLQQKCIFVHQNVPALNANDKMMHGRKKFIETLDAMTKEAADQEGIRGVQSFNQVIEFDSEKSVWYFSDLWHGDPPMAPVNPGYSESVASVKDAILYELTKERNAFLTLGDTTARIADLWNGILKDDFVFSFRNSLEFKAYSAIERECQKLIWELEKFIFEFEQKDAQMLFIDCKTDVDLNKAVDTINSKLTTEVEKLVSYLLEQLDTYIKEHSLKDVMIQWKQTKINRINDKKEGLLRNANQEINKTKEEIKIRNLESIQQRQREAEINKQATSVAVRLKGKKPSNVEIKETFEKWWTIWLRDLKIQEYGTEQNIHDEIKSHIWGKFPFLTKFLKDDWQLFENVDYTKFNYLYKSFPIDLITDNCIEIHSSYLGFQKRDSKEACFKQALEITNMILQKIDTKLDCHQKQDFKFHMSYMNELLKIIDDAIVEHNTKKSSFYFTLLSPYQSRLICHVASFASIFYTNLQEAYNKKHGPKARLEAFKSTVWDLFRNTVDSKTEDFIALGLFKGVIIRETVARVAQLLPFDTQEKVRSMFSTKYSLIKSILMDVSDDFRQITFYIRDPSGFAEMWISKKIDEMLFGRQEEAQYCILAKKRIKKIFLSLSESALKATDSVDYDIQEWLNNFVGHIKKSKELPLSTDAFVHVRQRNVKNSKSFGQLVFDELDNMEKLVLKEFRATTAQTVKWTVNPVSGVMETLWGCKEKCMFCNEPCINGENHTGYPHKCLQHRPQGVSGWHCSVSEKLVVDFCNHLVQSDQTYAMSKEEKGRPYREYKKEFQDWEIAPNSDVSKYWMYILCKYKDDLLKLHNLKEPDMPAHWSDITKDEAINSL